MNPVVAGFAIDLAVGDQRRLHPVAGFGAAAGAVERIVWRPSRTIGTLYAVGLVAATGGAVVLVERRLGRRTRQAFEALVLWSTLGNRSLAQTAVGLARALESGATDEARRTVPALVGRHCSGTVCSGRLAQRLTERRTRSTRWSATGRTATSSSGGAPHAWTTRCRGRRLARRQC
jgi:adenosylcobinamide-phosphate synthase